MRIRPARGLVLVKPAQTEETLPGGRILIPEDARRKMANHQVQIEDIGRRAICDNPDDCSRIHELDPDRNRVYHPRPAVVTPGAWVFVTPRSLVHAGQPEPLYFCHEDDILGVFTVPAVPYPPPAESPSPPRARS